jgi:hypothetical protein
VTLTSGDAVRHHDRIEVAAPGWSAGADCEPGRPVRQRPLRRFCEQWPTRGAARDLGGTDPNWVLNALDIRPLGGISPVTLSGPGGLWRPMA